MTALYDEIGATYARYRLADPRIAAAVDAALEGAARVVSVGSGTGTYEPRTADTVAVEPSRTMIAQRPQAAAQVVQAVAERLPFADRAFDAALAVLTVHHWPDTNAGLDEMRRVASRQVVLTWDPVVAARFWLLVDYLPEIDERERPLATVDDVCRGLDVVEVRPLLVHWDCTDGFLGAYWRRPERYLDAGARAAISGFALLDQRVVESAMQRLAADLADGTWATRHGDLLDETEMAVGYRLVIAARRD